MKRSYVLIPAAGLLVVAAGFTGLTYTMAGTASTTRLDTTTQQRSADGSAGLSKDIVAGRIESKFHPLPWVGSAITDTTCPTALPARVGARITCTAEHQGTQLQIVVTTTEVTSRAITWEFDR